MRRVSQNSLFWTARLAYFWSLYFARRRAWEHDTMIFWARSKLSWCPQYAPDSNCGVGCVYVVIFKATACSWDSWVYSYRAQWHSQRGSWGTQFIRWTSINLDINLVNRHCRTSNFGRWRKIEESGPINLLPEVTWTYELIKNVDFQNFSKRDMWLIAGTDTSLQMSLTQWDLSWFYSQAASASNTYSRLQRHFAHTTECSCTPLDQVSSMITTVTWPK